MRTSLLIVVPCVLLAGLVLGAYYLKDFLSTGAPCTLGTCPTTLYEGNTGGIFTYATGAQFEIILDERRNPARNLFCGPEGVILSISETPPAAPPLYTSVFQGIAPGTCTLSSNSFIATIIIQ